MGNTSVISHSGNTFVEQIKVDGKSSQKILGVFLNPREFPLSGLIVVTNKCTQNFNLSHNKLFSYSWKYDLHFLFCFTDSSS